MPWFEVLETIRIPYDNLERIEIVIPTGSHWIPETEQRIVAVLRDRADATEDEERSPPT